MSTRAYYHPRGFEVDLADLPRWLYGEIASLHGQIVKDESPPTCLGNGQPMYVYRHDSGRYYARHYPGENPDGHGHRMVTMSDEHRRQTEYAQRAADDHGLNATMEHPTGNGTRLDLAVVGAQQAGFEIQRSGLSRAQAKARTKKSFDAGWPTAWVTDSERAPGWVDHVPTARLTTGIDWTQLPPRNAARAIISKFTRERDKSKRSGWRYRREPHAVPLDELSYRMPAGEIVPVALGRLGAVSLAFAQACEVIDSCTHEGASVWRPVADTPRTKEAVQQFTRDCAHNGATPARRCPGCDKTLPAGWPEGHPCRMCEAAGRQS